MQYAKVNMVDIKRFDLSETRQYFELFSEVNTCKYYDIMPFIGMDDAEKYMEICMSQIRQKQMQRFSIYKDYKFVGTICLYSINHHQERASIGFAINEAYWGTGITKIAIEKLEHYSRKKFHRLQATVLPENIQSKKLLLKSGYACEGILHQYEKWEGKGFVDLEIYYKLIND